MAQSELAGTDPMKVGDAANSGEAFIELGLMYSTGNTVAADLVSAHKWFNIAAVRGSREAVRLRQEIAAEMSEFEIAAAQRAARDWLREH